MNTLQERQIARAKELGLDHDKMTRVITDPAEIEERQRRAMSRQRFQAAVFYRMPQMSIRARAKMNGSPRSHHAVMGITYLEWLRERWQRT